MLQLSFLKSMMRYEKIVLTLDELGCFGTLQPLEEQNEDLFPVLSDRFSTKTNKNVTTLSNKLARVNKRLSNVNIYDHLTVACVL